MTKPHQTKEKNRAFQYLIYKPVVEVKYRRVMLMWTAKHPQMLHKREQQAMTHVVGHPRTACTPNWFMINSPQLPSLCALPLASPAASWRTQSHLGHASFSPSSHTTSGTFESSLPILHHRTLSGPLSFTSTCSSYFHPKPLCGSWCHKEWLTYQRVGSLLHDLYGTAWFHACVAAKSSNKAHDKSDMTVVLQRSKRKVGEIHLPRLIYVTVFWICTQPHVNWNNRGIFIFIRYANRLMEFFE